ncbi:MAG: hypothetical protein Q9219_007177 [cf. Caloplaca sp. 3 TL-2023]
MDSPDMSLYESLVSNAAKPNLDQSYSDSAANDFGDLDPDSLFTDAMQLQSDGYGTTVHPADLNPHLFQSPESSASSSSSSGQHNRNASSDSSRSVTFDFDTTMSDGAQMHHPKLDRPWTNAESLDRGVDGVAVGSSLDRQMDQLFDFDSAANSPGDSVAITSSKDKPIGGVGMPQIERPPSKMERPILNAHVQKRPVTARSVASTPSSFKPESSWGYPTAQTQPFNCARNSSLLDNHHCNALYDTATAPAMAANLGFVGPRNFGHLPPVFEPHPAAFTSPNHFEQKISSTLLIHPIPPKTRVETQIPITLTLTPVPPGITRLHLPSRTIAKPKLLAKQKPNKSPDMLELEVMPVCASAIKRPGVYARALAIARGQSLPVQPGPRSSLNESNAARREVEHVDPTDGGSISICDGCIMRERKRANRRMEKEVSDEDARWQLGEKERIVVFNESEVVEWKPYGSPDLHAPASRRARGGGRGKKKDETGESVAATTTQLIPPVSCPELTKQVRLLMRITCYCRHQGEFEGFQVILTLKDHSGRCIAQEISTPILITDDHKTSTIQNDHRPWMVGNESRLHSNSFFPPPSNNVGIAPQVHDIAQSHSTTDLSIGKFQFGASTAHRSATSASLQRLGQAQGSRSTGFSTPSQDSSFRTSATLTPRNLSRHVSPSATSGPTPKRRKASDTDGMRHRPLVDLSMTRMQTVDTPTNLKQSSSVSPTSSSEVSEGLAMAPATISDPTSVRDNMGKGGTLGQPLNPTPPPSASFPHQDSLADVTPSRSSGRQGPLTVSSQPTSDMAAHAQALHHSLLHVPGAVAAPAGAPTLQRIIPLEGPKSGGIDVTVFGEGFHNDLVVLFADAPAPRITVVNSQVMICMIPPSYQAGSVRVSLRGRHQPEPNVMFRYIDTDEQDLMRLALAVFHHRSTGKLANASDIARSIIGGQQLQNNQQLSAGVQDSQISRFNAIDLEKSILGVIDLIDQTDSVIAPCYSLRQSNGQTMLHLSASLGYHRLVAGLLARGTNPNLCDRNGMSALHMACFRGHTKIVRKLLSAGGDPTSRSLLGLAPVDMATTLTVHHLVEGTVCQVRSRSAGATPATRSRASSLNSVQSIWAASLRDPVSTSDMGTPFRKQDPLIKAYRSTPSTPADSWARSRRNSTSMEQQNYLPIQPMDDPTANTHFVTAVAAMAAWRDNLAGQIQHFHQSVQRTLPNLQIPNLPPLPTFEAYQEFPMVRRISSLVPRMNSPPAPPSYDEIYPGPAPESTKVRQDPATHAVGDALMDKRYAANFGRSETKASSPVKMVSEVGNRVQVENLRIARTGKVKNLSNDRKLFFVWIPLLILVVIAMMKDWAPQLLHGAQQVFKAGQKYLAA